MLPSDVGEEEVLSAIQDRLQVKRYSALNRNSGPTSSLKTNVEGRWFVPVESCCNSAMGGRLGQAGAGEDRESDPAWSSVEPIAGETSDAKPQPLGAPIHRNSVGQFASTRIG